MIKRILTFFLVLAILCVALPVQAFAAQERASDYIASSHAFLSQGNNQDEIDLRYTVQSGVGSAGRIGISKIQVYRANGSLYKMIFGSTTNGLIKTNTSLVAGSYTISCVAGVTYYCVVTFIVSDAGGGDSCVVTTSTAIAHP